MADAFSRNAVDGQGFRARSAGDEKAVPSAGHGAVFDAQAPEAAVSVHWKNGVFAVSNGIEVPLLFGVAGAGLALTGPGGYSLDALLGLSSV
jgi:hypothetical protein